MSDIQPPEKMDRRNFLRASGLAGAGIAAASIPAVAQQRKPESVITEVQDWAGVLGDGVQAHPYGKPSE